MDGELSELLVESRIVHQNLHSVGYGNDGRLVLSNDFLGTVCIGLAITYNHQSAVARNEEAVLEVADVNLSQHIAAPVLSHVQPETMHLTGFEYILIIGVIVYRLLPVGQ